MIWLSAITLYLLVGTSLAEAMSRKGKFDKPGVDKTTLFLCVVLLWPISLRGK